MSLLGAVSEDRFGVLITDTRRPRGEDSFSDQLLKQARLKDGFIGWTGAGLRWVRLRGSSLDELNEKIPRLHASGVRWAESRKGRRSEAERSHGLWLDGPRPEGIPEGVDPRTFTQLVAISLTRPGVHVFRTHGPQYPGPVPSLIAFPPGGTEAEDEKLIERARKRGGPPTDGVAWGTAVRALGALAELSADRWERVGPVVDVGLVDRQRGELRRCRAPAAELATASDAELLDRIQVPTLGAKVFRRLRAAAWTARTKLETT